MKRPFEYSDLKSLVPEELSDKLDYHACEVYDITARAYEDEAAIHGVNEPVMRSYFTKLYNFSDNDIIISIDADEILYGEQLPYIIEQVSKQGAVRLKLRQFFYKKTYLWEGRDFVSPIATYYGVMNPKFPNNWRDVGNVTEEYVGCHFSWCMGIEAMIHKLDTYSHPRYRFCADRDLLENSVANKTYPFDDNVSFDIRELPADDSLIPKSMRS